MLGFDAAGEVARRRAGGDACSRPGDAVYYAGSIARPGTNAELHLVDERIVGRKPASLGWAEAAALPLTAITAWEMLFDRLEIRAPGARRRARASSSSAAPAASARWRCSSPAGSPT